MKMDPGVINVPEQVLMQENLHCNAPVDFMQRERETSLGLLISKLVIE